jgi:acetyl-CoA carboxylase biotin carboxyl carrier protein
MMTLNYADVGEILKMIDSSSCTEVVLELDGVKLVVRKGGQSPSVADESSTLSSTNFSPLASTKAISESSAPVVKSFASSGQGTADGEIIKSPMVGTYYSKPSPENAPFAILGQTVKKGETLCLIEVMKLFTSVEATKDGLVAAIFAEDGELVEFDQPLFSIS